MKPAAALLASLLGVVLAARAADDFATGITEPFRDSRVSASVAGTVRALPVKEGATVRQGDAIVEMDKDLEELELARRKLVWESKAEVNAANDRVAALKLDVERTRSLFDSTQSVSREEVEKRELEYKMAGWERDRIRDAKDRERIEYEMAAAQLKRRVVTAPFDGVVTDILLDLGEDCEPRRPIARIVDATRCYLVCNVDAAAAQRLAQGATVGIETETAGGFARREAVVEFISPVADPASGLRKVKVVFDNTDRAVAPGVTGRLLLPRRPAPGEPAGPGRAG